MVYAGLVVALVGFASVPASGSALMRHMWLRAVKVRAEGGEVDPCGGHDATLYIEQKCSIMEK